MRAGFTPGPWLTQNERDGEWSVWTRQPHIGTLASVHREDINGKFPSSANARLIAAAPEMYEALKELLKPLEEAARDAQSEGMVIADSAEAAFGRARAALAKATTIREHLR